MATPDELICDGEHSSHIQVHLRDADGHDVDDGTPVYFQINGRTGSLQVHAGNMVKADEASLVVINQLRPIYARFTLPERMSPTAKTPGRLVSSR